MLRRQGDPKRLTSAPSARPAPPELRSWAVRCTRGARSPQELTCVTACVRAPVSKSKVPVVHLAPQAQLRRVCGAGRAEGALVVTLWTCSRNRGGLELRYWWLYKEWARNQRSWVDSCSPCTGWKSRSYRSLAVRVQKDVWPTSKMRSPNALRGS